MTCHKRKFSKKGAGAVLKKIKKRGRQWRRENRAYFCEGCNAWHLTSQAEDSAKWVAAELRFKELWKRLLRRFR